MTENNDLPKDARKYEIEGETTYKTKDDLPPPHMSLLGRDTLKGPEKVFFMLRDGVTFRGENHANIDAPKYWRFNIEKV